MADDRTAYASEEEVAQLREEVRRLKDERERNGRPQSDGNGRNERWEGGDRNQADGDEKGQAAEKKPHPLRTAIVIGVVLAVAGLGLAWWLHARHFEGTDDATVDGHMSGIAARISGTIVGVYVEENQFVKAGQLIVDLDPSDYKAALAQAQGQVRQAEGQTLAEQPNVPVTETTNETNIANASSGITSAQAGVAAAQRKYEAALDKVREAEATNLKAETDVERYRPLAEKDEVPRQQFDQVVANAKATSAMVSANQATAEAARREVDQSREQLVQAEQRSREVQRNGPRQVAIQRATLGSRQGAVAMARAQLEQAGLNLGYCKIQTPVDGIVAKRMAEVGMHVTPGQQVVLVTQVNDLWVTANFRETQLRRMRPGQIVRIHVDALDADYDGYLESLPAASGAVTSLLPPENATGNFVKVVQRLPVRIRFNQNQGGLDRLRPGMSVEPSVRVD